MVCECVCVCECRLRFPTQEESVSGHVYGCDGSGSINNLLTRRMVDFCELCTSAAAAAAARERGGERGGGGFLALLLVSPVA